MVINEIILNSIYLFNFLFFSFLSITLFQKMFNVGDTKGENLLKASLIFSIAIAVSPLYTGQSYGLIKDLMMIWLYSSIALFLLIIGHLIIDHFIFSKVDNIDKIKEGNIALSISEGANFIATGLIVKTIIDNMFSIDINHIQFWLKLVAIYLFVQLLLALSLYLYEQYLIKIKNINLKELIYDGNISSSIHISSNYIIVSFLLTTAFAVGKTTLETLIITTLYFLISLILMEITRFFVDFILFREEKLSQLIKEDNYFKIIYMEIFVISIIFIYQFLALT